MRVIIDADLILEGFDAHGSPLLHESSGLVVDKGKVVAIAPSAELQRTEPATPRLGGPGVVVTPGFINAHHHVGTTPLQLGSPDHPLELWFASRLALRDVDPRLDTLYAAFEMIASGVTTVQHLHSRAPGTVDQVLTTATAVMDAYRAIGMRASYSMALRDQNRLAYEADEDFVARLPANLRPAMADYFRRFTMPLSDQVTLFHALRDTVKGDPLIAVQLAPANLHWLSDHALSTAADLAAQSGAPLHMHLVETPYQKAYAKRRTGGTAFEHIHRLGLTGPHLTIGHGVWMTEADIALCAATGTRLCHNCSSNFRLKSGVAPVQRFIAEGVPVALGIDEAGINDDRDMLQEMRLVLQVHRKPGIETPSLAAADVLRMATQHGAGTTPFGETIGRLRPGSAADLVLFDWERVTRPYQNEAIPPLDVLVRRARTQAVKAVMIAGDIVYADGRFTRVDREAVMAELKAWFARPLSDAERERIWLSREVFPHVQRFYQGWLEGL